MFGLATKRSVAVDEPTVSISLDRLIAMRTEIARDRHLPRKGVTHLPGSAQTRLQGRGLDFDEMRPYSEGDDVRHIDWNVTARTGSPHTRLYREERERAVTVALDLRDSMFTGSSRLKSVAAAEAAAAILWRVVVNRDRAGAIIFNDALIAHSRPAARERGVLDALALVDRMLRQQQAEANRTRPLDGVVAEINRLGRWGGLVVLVTGCDTLGPHYQDELAIAGRRGRLVVIRLTDALELEAPPPGIYDYRTKGRSVSTCLTAEGRQSVVAALARANLELANIHAAADVPYLVIPTTVAATCIWPDLVANRIV